MNLVFDAADIDESLVAAREEFEKDPDYVAAGMATDIAEQFAWLMNKRDISRSALAALLGVNRAYVTKVLNAPPNMTLRSIAAIALALNARADVHLTPIEDADNRVELMKLHGTLEAGTFFWTTASATMPITAASQAPPKVDARQVLAAMLTTAGE